MKSIPHQTGFFASVTAVTTLITALAGTARADVVTDWNLITLNATKTAGQNSNLGSRIDAIEAIAVYDAVNSIRQFGKPYHYYAPDTGSAQAAAAQAAHDVLINYFPSQATALNAALTNSLAAITDGPVGNGQTVGAAAAADIAATSNPFLANRASSRRVKPSSWAIARPSPAPPGRLEPAKG